MESDPGDVTVLLRQVRGGVEGAEDRLANLVYRELRRVAAAKLRSERQAHTLTPTALANEAWVRFGPEIPKQDLENRRHFFGIAVTAMRRVLIEHARARHATKRGGAVESLDLDAVDIAAPSDEHLLAVDDALTRLAAIMSRPARVVELRFFGGFTHSEIADILDVERRTVDRDWAFAKVWLFHDLERTQNRPTRRQ